MAIGLLGRKVGVTQIYDDSGKAIPVTVIEAGPCTVLQVRTLDRDGYEAVQLGFIDKPRRLARRSERGHVTTKLESKRAKARAAKGLPPPTRAECEPKRYIREFRCPVAGYQVGNELRVELFEGVARVDVTATSKGEGFQGVMKRHNFAGQRASHGVKKVHRHGGGTGCNTFPARTFPGRRMAGHAGNERVTIRNITLVKVDKENNLLMVHGCVPGPAGGLVMVRPTNHAG